jgi:two-component system response regulator AtoC
MTDKLQAQHHSVPQVLIIDDDDDVRTSLASVLETAGYAPLMAQSGDEGLKMLANHGCDILLCDLRLPGISGLDVLRACKGDTACILMTAYGDSQIVGEALRAGAYDYITKPIVPEELFFTLKKFEEVWNLKRENQELRRNLSEVTQFQNVISKSASFKVVFDTVQRLSQFSTTVMITGESGTGKELIARAIHDTSTRKNKPFIAINCGAIPESLMESELFGHRKGAFTDAHRDKRGLFEEAHGGTLFLDEIGELPLRLQVKLLRAIQERTIRRVGDEQDIPIDVRIISATLRDLEDGVHKGTFREDLLYRLNVVAIHLPPLRERSEDIPILVQHFIDKHSLRLGIPVKRIPSHVMKELMAYEWRGNARELENCIERALVLSHGDEIELESLPDRVRQERARRVSSESKAEVEDGNDILSIKQRTADLEVVLIKKALEKTKGNKTHAAKLLDISHRALLYKLKEYGIVKGEGAK